jgi:hypothetical protein
MARSIDRHRLMSALALAVGVAAIGGGCVGNIGDSGGSGGGDGPNGKDTVDAPTKFTCDAKKKPAMGVLRARTTAQYQNTISDLVSWSMKDKTAGAALMTELADSMAALPTNIPVVPQNDAGLAAAFPDGGWLRADQDQQFFRVQAFYNIGIAVAKALTSDERFGAVVGSCATDADASNDAACLKTFIQTFGPRALGRPITSADIAFYSDVYGSDPTADPDAYADVITVMLNAPEFLYSVEHGDKPVEGLPGVYTLTAHELASRLSYHVWDTMPDDELWAAAEDGSLLSDAVYEKEIDRLFSDPRAKTAMHGFFGDYMQVRNTGGPRGTGGLNYHDLALRDTDPVFKAFAGSDLPSPDLEPDMVDDALEMLDYYVWSEPGTVHDLLTSSLSFAKSSDVAKIYGVKPWDGKSTPPSLPEGQRPGLFTRALFVSAGVDTSPILKGVYLRRYLLCDTIGRPPPQAANAMVSLSTNQTTRQVTEALTSVSPCSGCHTNWLNPLGFATEDFDGLGRHRTEQTLFDPKGHVANRLPIDTAVVPYVEMEDGTTKASGAADVMTLADKSDKPAACLTRNYFRYTFARFEDLDADGCALETMRAKLDNGGHLKDMVKSVVATPAFKQRTFE